MINQSFPILELSDVLWGMIFQLSLKNDSPIVGPIMIYVIFIPWASLTIGILVGMEGKLEFDIATISIVIIIIFLFTGLSAFLHTLRLHWVEFMSKFYVGLGYAFQPFSFKAIIEGEDEAAE